MYVILSREPTGECHLCGVPVYSDRDLAAHLASPNHRLAYAEALADRHDHRAAAPAVLTRRRTRRSRRT
jgi:hypothetical protein